MVGSSSMPQLDIPDRRRLEAGISARLLSKLGIDKACLRHVVPKILVPRSKIPTSSKNEMLHFVQHDIKGLHSVSKMELSRATFQGLLGRRFTARSK